mmetsp:Transcript_17590/g.56822  ORF Transcript_17590/g.56822 Transcript_17590/m.56822 type:complete len:209 (+) Transcript_17590:1378-2004(+)
MRWPLSKRRLDPAPPVGAAQSSPPRCGRRSRRLRRRHTPATGRTIPSRSPRASAPRRSSESTSTPRRSSATRCLAMPRWIPPARPIPSCSTSTAPIRRIYRGKGARTIGWRTRPWYPPTPTSRRACRRGVPAFPRLTWTRSHTTKSRWPCISSTTSLRPSHPRAPTTTGTSTSTTSTWEETLENSRWWDPRRRTTSLSSSLIRGGTRR